MGRDSNPDLSPDPSIDLIVFCRCFLNSKRELLHVGCLPTMVWFPKDDSSMFWFSIGIFVGLKLVFQDSTHHYQKQLKTFRPSVIELQNFKLQLLHANSQSIKRMRKKIPSIISVYNSGFYFKARTGKPVFYLIVYLFIF